MEPSPEERAAEVPLEGAEISTYRACVGLELYIAPDREDIQDAVRRMSSEMQKPTSLGLVNLVRSARYLSGTRHYRHLLPKHGDASILKSYSDAGFAGDKVTRTSTTCGVLTCGGATLASFSRTQKAISLSSGEAENYAAVDTACESLFMKQVLQFLDVDCRLEVHTDSSACIGVAMRSGCGRIRHLETRSLWLQQRVARKDLTIEKVLGTVNPADIGTKPLAGPRLRSLLALLNMQGMSNRVREVAAAAATAVSPEIVQKILWLTALFEQIGRAKAVDVTVSLKETCGVVVGGPEDEEAGLAFFVFMLIVITTTGVSSYMLGRRHGRQHVGDTPPSVTVAHEEAEERAMTLEHELAECRAYLVEISREMATEASMSGSLVKDSESQTTDTSVDTRPARREMMTQAPVHYT